MDQAQHDAILERKKERYAKAEAYLARPDTDLFSLEGVKAMITIVDDDSFRHTGLMILSTRESVKTLLGSEAGFELFTKAVEAIKSAAVQRTLLGLLQTMLEKDLKEIELDTLISVATHGMVKSMDYGQELQKLGSAIAHLIDKERRS